MAGSSDSNLNPGETDPFAHLHKMSTTAGVGSGDYVAINATAIACVLLGLLSADVLFDNLVFLIVPIAGLITGIIAWQQISRSNGTQTGRGVAAIGLLLSIGFGGFYSIQKVYGLFQYRSDQDQIVSQLHKLGEMLHQARYDEAYALFDDDFKKKFPAEEFTGDWKQFSASPYLGAVQKIDWNHLLNFEKNPVDESRQASGTMLIYVARTAQAIRSGMILRNVEGIWLIDQLPDIFRQREKAPTSVMGPPKPK